MRQHAFFSSIDWSTPLWQQPSVYTPTIAAPTDTSNFQMNALARVQARSRPSPISPVLPPSRTRPPASRPTAPLLSPGPPTDYEAPNSRLAHAWPNTPPASPLPCPQANRMRSALEADHSDKESDAESESASSFKRVNPAQLAKMQLHQTLTKASSQPRPDLRRTSA